MGTTGWLTMIVVRIGDNDDWLLRGKGIRDILLPP